MPHTFLETVPQLKEPEFSLKADRKKTSLFTLKNDCNMVVKLTNYGARIVSLVVPDENGMVADVVLGYDTLQEYLTSNEKYFGATIGRFANRIAGGKLNLNNQEYLLEKNNLQNHLHGGVKGFHCVVWDVLAHDETHVVFRYTSEDGESGYPGTLVVDVSYTLNNEGEVIIDYLATTDKTTIINLTNHAYFNLSGAGSGRIDHQKLLLKADKFTPISSNMIPTGELRSVDDTPFDFRVEKEIGKEWDSDDEQVIIAGGFDHNFVLDKKNKDGLQLAARVTDPCSGRVLEVETTEPGIHFYTANSLTGKDIGREGIPYLARTAFCLETQHFPDSPNHSSFPGVVLEPGEKFKSKTVYRFNLFNARQEF